MFWAIAFICEEYGVHSITLFCHHHRFSDDIIGSLFIGTGLSLPVFFVALVGLFFSHSSIGVGAVIGGNLFNHLVTIPTCIYVSPNKIMKLDAIIFTREMAWYLLSCLILVWAAKGGNIVSGLSRAFLNEEWLKCLSIEWLYSFLLVIGYILYCCFNLYFYHILDSALTIIRRMIRRFWKKTRGRNASRESGREEEGVGRDGEDHNSDSSSNGEPTTLTFDSLALFNRYTARTSLSKSMNWNNQPTEFEMISLQHQQLLQFANERSHNNATTDRVDGVQDLEIGRRSEESVNGVPERHDKKLRFKDYHEVIKEDIEEETESTANSSSKQLLHNYHKISEAESTTQLCNNLGNDVGTRSRRSTGDEDDPAMRLSEIDDETGFLLSNRGTCASTQQEGFDYQKYQIELFSFPYHSNLFFQAFYFLTLPVKYCIFLSVPDCRRPEHNNHAVLSTFMSLLWLFAFSYFLTEGLTLLGNWWQINSNIMGLTVAAWAANYPAHWSSVVLAKEGYGDIASCNVYGSNVFNNFIGLGLPWIMYSMFYGGASYDAMQDSGLVLSMLVTMFIIVLHYGLCILYDFTLTAR
jgi:Ca2+/Na+ antiporter